MTNQISIYDPTAPRRGAGSSAAAPQVYGEALTTLAGKVIGIIDNSKPNFNNLADALAKLMVEKHGVASVQRHRKHAASLPAVPGVAADFAARCDLVITGSGD